MTKVAMDPRLPLTSKSPDRVWEKLATRFKFSASFLNTCDSSVDSSAIHAEGCYETDVRYFPMMSLNAIIAGSLANVSPFAFEPDYTCVARKRVQVSKLFVLTLVSCRSKTL